jgi:hypothetical protein
MKKLERRENSKGEKFVNFFFVLGQLFLMINLEIFTSSDRYFNYKNNKKFKYLISKLIRNNE